MKFKTLVTIVTCLLPLLTFMACSDTTTKKVENRQPQIKSSDFTNIKAVPLSEATLAIYNYGNWCRSLDIPVDEMQNVTRAFLIPGIDLIGVLQPNVAVANLLGECNYSQARAYIGLDTNNVIHLYLTPVNEEGVDVILSNPTDGSPEVFDLTTPCPRTCDETSLLYNAFADGGN